MNEQLYLKFSVMVFKCNCNRKYTTLKLTTSVSLNYFNLSKCMFLSSITNFHNSTLYFYFKSQNLQNMQHHKDFCWLVIWLG